MIRRVNHVLTELWYTKPCFSKSCHTIFLILFVSNAAYNIRHWSVIYVCIRPVNHAMGEVLKGKLRFGRALVWCKQLTSEKKLQTGSHKYSFCWLCHICGVRYINIYINVFQMSLKHRNSVTCKWQRHLYIDVNFTVVVSTRFRTYEIITIRT